MTHREALEALSGYPIPRRAVDRAAIRRGVDLAAEADAQSLAASAFRLAEADIYMWLVIAPNVSQGGISFTLSAEERSRYKALASAIYSEQGETADGVADYGYKGTRL